MFWGVVVGIGTGLTAMVLAVTVATRWFNHRRGLVMGLFAASNATGQLVFLPLIAQDRDDLRLADRADLSSAPCWRSPVSSPSL